MMSLSAPFFPPTPTFKTLHDLQTPHTPRTPSLPLPQSSPFLDPFSNNTYSSPRLSPSPSPRPCSLKRSSTWSLLSSSPTDLGSPSKVDRDFIKTAYVASRSGANLIQILDIEGSSPPSFGTESDDTMGDHHSVTNGIENRSNLQPRQGTDHPLSSRAPSSTPVDSAFPGHEVRDQHGSAKHIRPTETTTSASIIHAHPSHRSSIGSAPSRGSSRGRSSTRRTTPLNDKSFLRLSMTTASMSEFTPSSHITSTGSTVEEEMELSSRRSSAGTFGRARRWSVSTGSLVDREVSGTFRGAKEASETFLSDDELGPGDHDDESMTSSQRRRRRRHQSASSSSASGGPSGPMSADAIAIHNSKGLFPSPTQPKKTHRKPESDAAITAHLLRTASELRNAIEERTGR
ncbi:hypothetical protein BD324DRAFT_355283 [Kockovaella imperatae]|uniref:Uncharacterized protein n=1 Tax=Kockovaella imperatae TaxID=4999 RepID=A0A1Y1UK38_9TREE|nr:hypothetical protein BD324DRAFT_355283 [Kockovaella imperatae]ORX38418.1 hypothetical protein BD324DRAFT_355283 [Kockovaella imperatae]